MRAYNLWAGYSGCSAPCRYAALMAEQKSAVGIIDVRRLSEQVHICARPAGCFDMAASRSHSGWITAEAPRCSHVLGVGSYTALCHRLHGLLLCTTVPAVVTNLCSINPALVDAGADTAARRRRAAGVCGRRHGRLGSGRGGRARAGGVVRRGAARLPADGARHDAGEHHAEPFVLSAAVHPGPRMRRP